MIKLKLKAALSPSAVSERDDFFVYNERTGQIAQSELGVERAIHASTILNGHRCGDNYRFVAKDDVEVVQ